MFKFVRILACVGLLASSAAAHATSYQFSYTYLDGSIASGSFDGVANGNLVTNISHLSLFITDSSAPGSSFSFPNNGNLFTYDLSLTAGAAVVSFDGLQTNLLASDVDLYNSSTTPTSLFLIGAFNGGATDAINYSTATLSNGEGNGDYSAARWSLSAVSAVPEPASYVLLLGGLTLLGGVARRRS